MAKITILCGMLLIGLGIIGYLGAGEGAAKTVGETTTEQTPSAGGQLAEDAVPSGDADAAPAKKSVTALIPAFVGLALAICGFLALDESKLKHAMHAAAMIGLLGTLAGVGRGAMGLGKFFSGDPSLNQRSFLFVWLMALICGVFVFLCVRSFINVRRQRQAAEQSA